jgi:hypothetical protein
MTLKIRVLIAMKKNPLQGEVPALGVSAVHHLCLCHRVSPHTEVHFVLGVEEFYE